jgi:two-component system cell cycle response regulator
MADSPITVLLIEDNSGDARLIREVLAADEQTRFESVHADRLATGLAHLARGGVDIVLLDLSLPDSRGLETFTRTYAFAPLVPIIVLTGLDDTALAMEAVTQGAQDYLVKGAVSGSLLVRAMRYAIERHRLIAESRMLATIDDLTGLFNRRCFAILATQQLKLRPRLDSTVIIVCTDIDGLKQINDLFGHAKGDRTLIRAAQILRATFRESDIVARLGGDEFAVCATASGCDQVPVLTARLQQNIEATARLEPDSYALAMSIGVACCDSKNELSLEELLAQADREMYEQKQRKRNGP